MTETNDPLGHQVVSAKEVVKVHSKKKKHKKAMEGEFKWLTVTHSETYDELKLYN